MKTLNSGLLAAALTLGLLSGASAQTAGTLAVKNAAGTTVNLACELDSASSCHYRDVMEGLLSTTQVPTALTIDGTDQGAWTHITNFPTTQAISATSLPLPTGAASAANQATAIADLASIETTLTGGIAVTGPLTNAQLTSAALATAANQTSSIAQETTTATNTATVATDLGALGSTACSTDTGSCNLNQLLQRLAQDITSVKTQLSAVTLAGTAYASAGVTTVTSSLTAAGVSSSFTPAAGRPFHVIFLSGTGSATCQLERQLDGTHWTQYTVNGSPFYTIAYTGADVSEDVVESQTSVPYRMDCGGASHGSFTSGTIAMEFTQ